MSHVHRLHYSGDRTGHVGSIVGPNELGETFVIDQATYDPVTNQTTAHLRHALTGDLNAAAAREVTTLSEHRMRSHGGVE